MTGVLEGKVALVTGGGKGIGAGISKALAEAGAKVAINGHQNMTMAEETAKQLADAGAEVMTYQADISDRAQVDAMVAAVVERFGGIDILVNNAAYQPNLDIWGYTPERLEMVLNINLYGYFRVTQACLPYLKKCGEGRIVNISSVHQKRPTDFDIGYAMSKGGMGMFTREAAVEFMPYGITTNTLLPGGTKIEFKSGETFKIRHKFVERERSFPRLGRNGLPADSGGMTVFLCSKAGEHFNGNAIRVDGGMMCYSG